jgi:SAM-dependent methyltransferase
MVQVPDFIERNCTKASFWDERFEQQFTPWDKGTVPARLQDFMANDCARLVPGPGCCFIPGCGNAWEVALFAQAGWQVTAIDFSAQAVARAQAQLGPWAQCVKQADFFRWQDDHPQATQFDLIYERAFLCALPPGKWPEIVTQWARLLRPGGLLLGFFYFATQPGGPPFGSDPEQLRQYLSPHFRLLDDQDVPDSIAVFAGKERWQIWQRHDENAPDATGT